MRRIIFVLFIVSFLCVDVYALDFFQLKSKDVKVSDFTLQNLEGDSVSLSDFSDKAVILFFWTTWCPHCLRELTNFNREYENMKSSNIELLAIDIGESKAKVKSFIGRNSIKYPILMDADNNVASKYDVVGVPTIILISKQREIVSVLYSLPSNYKNLLVE
ncbi:MAG: TlpA disulfide reductase family protein [Candidatus Omnitrophota bacterium]